MATTTQPPRTGPLVEERSFWAEANRPSLAGRPDPERPTRQVGPAGRVIAVGVVCFALWSLLAAPKLLRNAEASPLGTRRSAALAILRPLARVSEALGLDRIEGGTDTALGRQEDPAPAAPPAVLSPSPLPTSPSPVASVSPTPTRRVETTPSPSSSSPPLVYLPAPTGARPLTILLVGDSIGADLAIGFQRILSGEEAFRVRPDAREATGLTRPDYFDWPGQIAEDIGTLDPGVVVAMFGANDQQGMLAGGEGLPLGTAEWRAEYRKRVAQIMDLVTGSGRPLIWVGMPVMRDLEFSKTMQMINAIVGSEAPRHDGVLYVDAWGLMDDGAGGYTAYLPSSTGAQEQVRTPDGVHLTATGSDRLAEAVFAAIRTLWTSGRRG